MNNTYTIEFYTCPAHIPFSFAVHPWIVTTKNGQSTRWEIIHREYPGKERFGFLYKNFYSDPKQGIKKHSLSNQYWHTTKIGEISGGEESLAASMFSFIENMSPNYPFQNNYTLFPGPNSNTYVAWVLKHFPEAKIQLPWNAFGKNL